MSEQTAKNMVDWAYTAITFQGLKGRRVVFGYDFMGMETVLIHILANRNSFGIAACLAYCSLTGMFTLVWGKAETIGLPEKLSDVVWHSSRLIWTHTFIMQSMLHWQSVNNMHR